ncbi:hypothetical protein Bbelb_100720 [Branchiostoma belcheri]|nr:hypothetical protein Bbelb_100720 [Branchiostoma belcheri]
MAALSRHDMYSTPSELVSEDPFPHVGNNVTSYLKDFYRTQFEQECPLLLREEHELHLTDIYTDPHIQCRGDMGHSNDVKYMAAHFLWSEVASGVRDESYSLRNELKHMLTSPKLNDVHKFFKGIFKHNSGSMANQERLAVLFEAHHDAIKDSEGIDI